MRFKPEYLGALALTCIFMLTATPEAQAISGSGTEADPYRITTANDLAAMHDDLNGFYQLDADLDLGGVVLTPVGNESEGPFSGTLDGNGHTLSNLTLDKSGNKYVGLFGYLEGAVQDLTLSEVSVEGGRYVGAVAGYAAEGSSLSGCTVTSGSVTATGAPTTVSCGGVVGHNAGSVANGSNGASISATEGSYTTTVYTGGLVGYCSGTLTLTDCTNAGSVSGAHYTGGFVGYAAGTATLTDCTNSGAVTTSNNTADTRAGGLMGYAGSKATLSGCQNTAAVFANSTLLSKNAYSGGMVGYGFPAHMDNCENTGRITVRVAYRSGGYSLGTGYAGGMAGSCGTAAIGCTNSGAVYGDPIYPYKGKYASGGLFGSGSGAATDCVNTGAVGNSYIDSVGGITASGSGTYLRCENRGALTSSSTGVMGGILGGASNSPTLTDCVNYPDLSGYKVGGIVGGSAACSGCKNYGSLSGSYGAGGILFGNSGSATNCLNTGDITGSWSSSSTTAPVSGIGGSITTNCVNWGSLRGDAYNRLYDMGYGTSSGGVSIADLPSSANRSAVVSITPYEVKINGLACTDLGVWSQGTARSLAQLQDSANPAYANWGLGITWHMDADVNSGLPRPAGTQADYLNQSVLFLTRGASSQLTAPFAVSSWESSDGSIASCSGGTVSALLPGRAVISACGADGQRANCVVFVYDSRSSCALSQTAATLSKGNTLKLTCDLPSDDPQGILWSSSDSSVVSVSLGGTITGKAKGTAVITASLPLSGVSASCTVTVTAPITALTLPATKTIEVGSSSNILSAVTPDPYDGSIAWTSSNEGVATVKDGMVTGVAPGTAVISALSDTGVSGSCTVTVIHPAATKLTLDRTQLTLELGLSDQLTATLEPAQTSSVVTWASTNTKVVTVDSKGVLTPVAVGQAAVTATANGLTVSCTVTVTKAAVPADSVTLSQTQLRPSVGEKIQLSATLSPANVTDPSLVWKSSDPAVATVSSTGVVEAIAPGIAEITVTTANGLYDLCTVKVAAVSSAAFVVGSVRVPVGSTAETTVHMVKNPGVAAFSLTMTYDPALMTPVAVTAEELLSGGTLTSNLETVAEPGKLNLTWYSDTDLAQDGPAFTVRWEGVKAGTGSAALTYEADNICNSEKINVGFQAEAGTIVVTDYLMGDIYRDGAVNMKDIVYFARWFNGQGSMDEGQQLAADLYWDSTLDAKDLVTLAQLLSQSIPESAALLDLFSQGETVPYAVAVSDGEVGKDGTVQVAVTGSGCPGLAAFRFRLDIPDGYEVTAVTPGSVLPDAGNFTYNPESGIVFWYSDQTVTLEDGTLFVLSLRSTLNELREGTVALTYAQADFFRAEDYAAVPISASAGTLSLPKSIAIDQVSVSRSGVAIALEGNLTGTAQAIVAFYHNGALCGVTLDTIDLTRNTHSIAADLPTGADTCTVYLLKAVGHTPLCMQKSVKL